MASSWHPGQVYLLLLLSERNGGPIESSQRRGRRQQVCAWTFAEVGHLHDPAPLSTVPEILVWSPAPWENSPWTPAVPAPAALATQTTPLGTGDPAWQN